MLSKGWSQTELAVRLDSTLKMIDYYERRANTPSVEFVREAARVLGVSMAELLAEEVQINAPARRDRPAKCTRFLKRSRSRQQEKIVEVVSALVSQYAQGRQ